MYTDNSKITLTITDCTKDYAVWEMVTTEGKRISEIKWIVCDRNTDPLCVWGYRTLYDAMDNMHSCQKDRDLENENKGGEEE